MPTTIDRDELQRLVRDHGAAVCEVLPHPEYAWAHLPGAIHLPLKSWNLTELIATVGDDRPVVVYCHDLQ